MARTRLRPTPRRHRAHKSPSLPPIPKNDLTRGSVMQPKTSRADFAVAYVLSGPLGAVLSSGLSERHAVRTLIWVNLHITQIQDTTWLLCKYRWGRQPLREEILIFQAIFCPTAHARLCVPYTLFDGNAKRPA